MDIKQIKTAIATIAKAVSKITSDIQAVAVAIVFHALQHGDVTPAGQLVNALGKALRSKALTDWFLVNGPFEMIDNTFTLNRARAKELRAMDQEVLREALMATPWEGAKVAKAPVELVDLCAELDKFFAKIDKQAGGATPPSFVGQEVFNTVRATFERLAALEVLKRTGALTDEEAAAEARRPVVVPTTRREDKVTMHLMAAAQH